MSTEKFQTSGHQSLTLGSGGFAVGLTVNESVIDGLGCFADMFFPKDWIITEYRGQKITNQEAARRMQQTAKPQISQVNDQWSVDGSVGGNGTQYLNHSCDPNACVCVIDERILLIARRNIFAGEEITVDYLNTYESDKSICNCGSMNCRSKSSTSI